MKKTALLLFLLTSLHPVFSQWTTNGNHIYNTNTENVGIGTGSPLTKLHINGDHFLTIGDYSASEGVKGILFTGWRDMTANFLGASIEAEPAWLCCGWPASGYPGVKSMNLNFNVHNPGDWGTANGKLTAMSIRSSGDIGIGTLDTKGYKLAVNGSGIFTKVVVKEYLQWPDYVFEKDYQLLPLWQLEKFIQQHKHLPDVPSAKEVAATGLDLAGNQAILLKKIEELTMYTIEQDKLMQAYRKEIEQLTKRIEKLETSKKQ